MKIKLMFLSIFALLVLGTTQYLLGQVICATCPDNTVSGIKASAFGDGNNVSGAYSLVAGRNSVATRPYSYVIGSFSGAEGLSSITIGNQSFAKGDYSYVFGNNSLVESNFSFALGHNLNARAGGFVIGQGRVDSILTNTFQGTLMIGFNSAFPTLFVSRTQYGYQSGRVGIGNITSPEAKLHIRADAGEDADLMLQATGTGKKAMLLFNGGPGMISNMDPSAPLQFYAGGGRLLGIHLDGATGNVGIGLDNPSAQLDILGSLRIRIGNPVAGMVLTSDAQGNASWQTPSGGGGGSNWTVSGSNIYRPTGYVGIGTTNPRERLSIDGNTGRPINFHIGGSQNIYSNAYYDVSDKRAKTGPAYAINFSSSRMAFRVAGSGAANSQISWNEVISINTDGNVGIGTTNPQGYKLAVNGKILAKEIKIELSVPSSDYVFEPDYPLMPLGELEQFVASKKHLPEVPSAEEFSKNGYSIGEMDDLLLRKIEELTLYIIQQQKEIDALKQQMAK